MTSFRSHKNCNSCKGQGFFYKREDASEDFEKVQCAYCLEWIMEDLGLIKFKNTWGTFTHLTIEQMLDIIKNVESNRKRQKTISQRKTQSYNLLKKAAFDNGFMVNSKDMDGYQNFIDNLFQGTIVTLKLGKVYFTKV